MLGLASYLRSFIPNYAGLVHPLTELTKGKIYKWTSVEGEAFKKLKKVIARPSILSPFLPELPVVIETDASDVGIGAVLKQVSGENEVIVEMASKKFSDVQRRWDTREEELYAIRWAIERWRDYVCLKKFKVRTDHNNLRFLTSVEKGKVFRWALWLSQYDFEIEFLSGEKIKQPIG